MKYDYTSQIINNTLWRYFFEPQDKPTNLWWYLNQLPNLYNYEFKLKRSSDPRRAPQSSDDYRVLSGVSWGSNQGIIAKAGAASADQWVLAKDQRNSHHAYNGGVAAATGKITTNWDALVTEEW